MRFLGGHIFGGANSIRSGGAVLSHLRWQVRVVAVLSVGLGAVNTVAQPAVAADTAFIRPTSAPVLDPFRLPEGKYGPGNRGIEYDTDEFDRIVAAARGTVVFAGPVAGSLFVTVDHGNGLESSYGFVGHILVREGEEVVAGDVVALAAGPFHFSVRLYGEYINPEPLFGTRRVVVRLVPHASAHQKTNDIKTLRGLSVSAARLLPGPMGLGWHQGGADEQVSPRANPGRFGVWRGFTTGKKEPTWPLFR